MQLLIADYKITSFAAGYKLSKRKGAQWKIISYNSTLEDALKVLFDLRVRTDTKDFVLDFNEASKLDAQKSALISRVEAIRSELLEGLNGK